MLELSLLKQYWNTTSSDPSKVNPPQLKLTSLPDSKTQVDIKGLMNNTILSSENQMVGSAAWMSYPIAITDGTKFNFTLVWDNQLCPRSTVESIIKCSPQGGFALVFQQESQTALGDYKGLLGQGLGYEGLSGVLAIEFDMYASLHNGQPENQNLMITAQIRHPKTQLLSSKSPQTIAKNSNPINFAVMQVEVGIFPNQGQEELLFLVNINGLPQLKFTTSYKQLGLETNRVYYFGFTSAQNLNKKIASGTLSVQNFRVFKTKPKFVDGQVSYLYEYVDSLGNNTYLEIRSSFYDLCMQKTTWIVYPTESLAKWQAAQEVQPYIMPFLYNRDTFVAGYKLFPLAKPTFYRPHILSLNSDVHFQLSLPTGRSQAIRMAFYIEGKLIQNVTAIDYFRQAKSQEFAFIVIEDSDLITGTLSVKGYANNNYQFNVYCYDKDLTPIAVPLSQIHLSVTSDYIRYNNSVYSNQVPLTCYGVRSQNTQVSGNVDTTTNYLFTCTFMPNVNGTYEINSPFLPSGRAFKVEIAQADQVLRILSSEYSQARVMGEFQIWAGSMVEIYLDLRDYLNNTYTLSPEDGCSYTNSYYFLGGQKYSFLFYDSFPYLRTQIIRAGVADFKVNIKCTRMEFDLQCVRCQKYVRPQQQYYYYLLTIPAYPKTFDLSLNNDTLMLPEGHNLVIDISFYDRYDNLVDFEPSQLLINETKATLTYNRNKQTFDFLKLQMPGKLMLWLNESDNLAYKRLQPRTNVYWLNISVPAQQPCTNVEKVAKMIYVVPNDKVAPLETNSDPTDTKTVDLLRTTQSWDRVLKAGEIGRLAFTLRNTNMLQLSEWLGPVNTTEVIDVRIIDGNNRNLRGTSCFIRLAYAPYEGDYFGWYYCTIAPLFATLQIFVNGQVVPYILPFSVLPTNASMVDKSFFAFTTQNSQLPPSQNFTIGSGGTGTSIMFRMYDDFNNVQESLLANREFPQLGAMTYNLTKIDTGVVYKYSIIPQSNSSNYFRIHFDNLLVGLYRLTLNMPSANPIQMDLSFNSSSIKVSPIYSWAFRENGVASQVSVNSYVTIRFFARNIHNQTIERNTESVLLTDQCRVYLTNSLGHTIMLNITGTFIDSTVGQRYFNYTTNEPLRRNGRYFAQIYFPESQQYMLVQNGTFNIADSFDPRVSELYLIRGTEQSELRMLPFDPAGGLANSFNATYYDPRVDGTLKFKLYFRTNLYFETVGNVSFAGVSFRNAYLGQAVYNSTAFVMQTNYTNIELRLISFNNDSLLIVPKTWSDQDRIEALPEGYYFIGIQGTQFSNQLFQLQWMFSLFNSDLGQQVANQAYTLFTPRFLNITAGEPFTFTAAIFGGVRGAAFNVLNVFQTDLLAVEIEKTTDNTPAGNIFYVTLYNEKTGLFNLLMSTTTTSTRQINEITVQVNPAPLYQLQILNIGQLQIGRTPIGTSVSFNFTFVDRFNNNIFNGTKERPNTQRVLDMVQVWHQNRKPVNKMVRMVNNFTYQANFTTYTTGLVSCVLPLLNLTNPTSTTIFSQMYNITFELITKAMPSPKYSYAILKNKEVAAGTAFNVEITLMDEYQNAIGNYPQPLNSFTVNVIPDQYCNTSAFLMQFQRQQSQILYFTGTITKACLYNIHVYFFSSVDGQVTIPCINCYLEVQPAQENLGRFQFLDARDMLISQVINQPFHLNRYDWNPKIIVVMKDQYDNLITGNRSDLQYDYWADLADGRGTRLIYVNLTSFKSFHYFTFCSEDEKQKQPCMVFYSNAVSFRIFQTQKGNQNAVVASQSRDTRFVENYGGLMNLDNINPISVTNSYLRILNQALLEGLPQDLPIIPEMCMGGEQYPIIGRLELKTTHGFRGNISFPSISKLMKIEVLEVEAERYTVNFYPGSTQGQVLFSLFVKDDYYSNTQAAIAKFYFNETEFTNRQILINCNRRTNYQKYLSQNQTLSQRILDSRLTAGQDLTFNLSGAVPGNIDSTRFMPYDNKIYINYLDGLGLNYRFSVVEDWANQVTSYRFTSISKSGLAAIVGSGIPDNVLLSLFILPGPVSAEFSLVTTDQFRTNAGQNASIFIQPFDKFGNLLNLTNTQSDLQRFTNYSQVYYAKMSLVQPEIWQPAPCFEVLGSRIRCSVIVTEKGLYRWRVYIAGEVAKCVNCYFRVIPTGRVRLANTIMTDLSQNFYDNQHFGINKFNVIPRTQYIYMKLFLKDEFDNAYLNEESLVTDAIFPMLKFQGRDSNMTISRLFQGRAHFAQVYKVLVLQTRTSLDNFAVIIEGNYIIQLVTNSLGTFSFPIFLRASRTSQAYPSPASTLTLKFRDNKQSLLQAGKFSEIQFGIFDFQQNFIQGFNPNLTFTFSIPLFQQISISNGDIILGQFRGLYERLLRIDRVNGASTAQVFQQIYQQQYTVQVDGFNQGGDNKFTALVLPGQFSRIQYSNNNFAFKALDAYGNDVDHINDPNFNLQVLAQLNPPQLATDFLIKMNYTSRFGSITPQLEADLNLTLFSLADSTLQNIPSAFVQHSTRNVIDYEKSTFQIIPQVLTAGKTFNLRINLVDEYYLPLNLSQSPNNISSLEVRLLHHNQRDVRLLRLQNSHIQRTHILMTIQVNQSGYYYLDLKFNGCQIYGYERWLYVEVDQSTGPARDQQWQMTMISVQRNKVSLPSIISNIEYVEYLKGQPVYFIARLCDRFGNAFYSSEIYDFYNVGDTALSARLRNYGMTRLLKFNTQINYNVMIIQASDILNRALVRNLVPSFYPLVNNDLYNSQKSYLVEIFSPSNNTANVNVKSVYLVLQSDNPLDNYHSVNVTNNQVIQSIGLYSTDFDNQEIKLRLSKPELYTIQIRNTDERPYLAEQITNFSLQITNTTQRNFTVNKVNVTRNVTLDTVKIQIIPYLNNAFYRVFFNSSTLYQNTMPLETRAIIQTNFSYNSNPINVTLPLWVFPQTPPNFLNPILNTTYLAPGTTKFNPATQITFNISLQYQDSIYTNDYQSAQRIKIFRKSTEEFTNIQVINKTQYRLVINLEGPQTNEFRIYYQDWNGALYPIITPEVVQFEINSANVVNTLRAFNEGYQYPKLGLGYEVINSFKKFQLQAFDPLKVKIVLLSNLYNGTYIIGNEFRASILIIDNQTTKCLTSKDYDPQTDVDVRIQRYDPITQQLMRISIDIHQITLVKKIISQQTSYCSYFSVAVLESAEQLNSEGNYSLQASFQTFAKANFTFQAKISGIDFSKTTIGWYGANQQSDSLIAEMNAYEEFNYIIYFTDVLGKYVSERTQYVKIQIKFDQQKLIEGKDYKYISRYDDRFKGYLITVQFFKPGSFQPEYYFNQQRADNIQIEQGPILFKVREPQCIKISVLSQSQSTLTLGQLFTFVFNCYDINGKEIPRNIVGLQSKAIFTNTEMQDQNSEIEVDALQNGIYRVQNKFYIEGAYLLKIYFNGLLIYSNTARLYTIRSEICKDFNGKLTYLCPNDPTVCASNYYECNYINKTRCTNPSTPFLCGDKCVSNMVNECCRTNNASQSWCPHLNTCVQSQSSQQCQTLNPNTPIYCQAKNSFVRFRHECCEDQQYNTTRFNGTHTLIDINSMVKCSYEDKCVPQDSEEYCFQSFPRECSEIYGQEFSLQCKNDGRCKRNQNECPSTRVCPFGYTQCPDYTCIRGTDKFSQCSKLSKCLKTLPTSQDLNGDVVEYIRCPDGVTCSRTYEDCPSLTSCMIAGQVVCPDGSCQNSEMECTQPNECNSDLPVKCPGLPGICAQSLDECSVPTAKSCGATQSLCANGECSHDCKASTTYNNEIDQNGLVLSLKSCASQNMIKCPNGECRKNYYECSDILSCPVPSNYTYSPSALICPGIQICSLDKSECSYSQCESQLNQQESSSLLKYDQVSKIKYGFQTCADGRCYRSNLQKQDACFTPISCSIGYFKAGGFGEFCMQTNKASLNMIQLAIIMNDYKCPRNQLKCITGECRKSADDCPSQITCPTDLPIQCRDGQCVKQKSLCAKVDQAIESNLMKCLQQGKLLCTSDLVTCTHSLTLCPSRSSCPIGYIKCWDESCIDPITMLCPLIESSKSEMIQSTCSEQQTLPFHCFADGSCRAKLEDCPSITFCPNDRPIKCLDGSCRASIKNCPTQVRCQSNQKFCPGEGTCVDIQEQCGTPSTCSTQNPFKCEDGQCVENLQECYQALLLLPQDALKCIENQNNYLCKNNKSLCTANITLCPSSFTCDISHPVKSQDSLSCFKSRDELNNDSQVQLAFDLCKLSNKYKCSDEKCSETLCPEWLKCQSQITPLKCWDGQCVSDLKLCNSKDIGCPFYTPIRCNYTGLCVSNFKDCDGNLNETRDDANSICMRYYNLNFACPFDGSCTSNLNTCPKNASNQCLSSQISTLLPDGSCPVNNCPDSIPYKCQNGLCVDQANNCPINAFTIEEIKYCDVKSKQIQENIKVPCGNGECVKNSDQCLPLYDCSYNKNSLAFFRCPDGTCRVKESDCPQLYSICPNHLPYMCSNGQCAKSDMDCFQNSNGCPISRPYKCEYTGECQSLKDSCINPMQRQIQHFIFPNYIPPVAPSPLVTYYGFIKSICQSQFQQTCRIGQNLPFCVSKLSDCQNFDTQCPVNLPIRCGNSCVDSPQKCIEDNCKVSQLKRCSTSTSCYQNEEQCLTQLGCPLTANSRCSSLGQQTCNQLPYSSFQKFYSQTCTTQQLQVDISSFIFSECANAETPYSCADGTCVSALGQCPTCIFYCSILKKCVKREEDCVYISALSVLNNDSYQNQLQLCPSSAPTRCVHTGKCVTDEYDCADERLNTIKSQYNQTFSGGLISDKCSYKTPLKCQDGRCVALYEECLIPIKMRLNKTTTFEQNPMQIPLKWGQSPDLSLNPSPCQVVCYDGSCRDKIENCPVIHGCYDHQKPYRCRSGFCARDKDQCFEIFGQSENEDPDKLFSEFCTDKNEGILYKRCEDGTCRPLSYNQTSGQLQSTCLPFQGCPIGKPYHCSSGDCVASIEMCAGSSQCPKNTPFRCKNLKCTENPINCGRTYSTYPALRLDRTFDPYQNTHINFAFTNEGINIGRLMIPSNQIEYSGTQAFNSQVEMQYRVQIYSVPDSLLDKVENRIPASRVSYLLRIYQLDKNNSLDRQHSIISPVIRIESQEQIKLNQAYVYFKLDREGIPQILDYNHDICLGKISNIEDIHYGLAKWECHSRFFEESSDGYLKYSINSFGVYALIINPDPDAKDATQQCGFICQNHLIILIIEIAISTWFVLFFYAINICHKAKQLVQPKKVEDLQQSIERSFTNKPQGGDFFTPQRGAINNTTTALLETFYQFQSPDGACNETDLENLREQLEGVDPSDPPLMPGQVVLYLNHQFDNQKKQIDVLKNQLQEYQEKEINNLSLIKAIFEKNKILQAQIDIEKEIKNSSYLTKSVKSRKPKKVKEDPTIMSEYNNIDAYLAQSMTRNNLLAEQRSSAATFEQYPGVNNLSIAQFDVRQQNDQSLQSIPLHHIYGDHMFISKSTKDLIQKNYKSTAHLDTPLDRTNPHNNILIQDDNFDQFQHYEASVQKRTETLDDLQLQSIEEEDKDGDEISLINKKFRPHPDIRDSEGKEYSEIRRNETQLGIDASILSKTMNSIFNKRTGQASDTKGYNMLMANEGISGTVHGNLIKLSHMDQDAQNRYEDLINSKNHGEESDDATEYSHSLGAQSKLNTSNMKYMKKQTPTKRDNSRKNKKSR